MVVLQKFLHATAGTDRAVPTVFLGALCPACFSQVCREIFKTCRTEGPQELEWKNTELGFNLFIYF